MEVFRLDGFSDRAKKKMERSEIIHAIPWIICAVDPKSGTNQKPVRRAEIPVDLLTAQVLERGFKG